MREIISNATYLNYMWTCIYYGVKLFRSCFLKEDSEDLASSAIVVNIIDNTWSFYTNPRAEYV